jgi:hypothetical protein
MTEHDDFLERLRGDARALRHRPDEHTLARIRARIYEHIAPRPTVMELLASWFRPLAATAVAIAIVAGVGIATIGGDDVSLDDSAVEVTVEGETYRVAD